MENTSFQAICLLLKIILLEKRFAFFQIELMN